MTVSAASNICPNSCFADAHLRPNFISQGCQRIFFLDQKLHFPACFMGHIMPDLKKNSFPPERCQSRFKVSAVAFNRIRYVSDPVPPFWSGLHFQDHWETKQIKHKFSLSRLTKASTSISAAKDVITGPGCHVAPFTGLSTVNVTDVTLTGRGRSFTPGLRHHHQLRCFKGPSVPLDDSFFCEFPSLVSAVCCHALFSRPLCCQPVRHRRSCRLCVIFPS